MLSIDLTFKEGKNNLEFSTVQKEIIKKSGDLMIDVLNSQEFKDEVLNFQWFRRRGGIQERFNHTKDSRELVYSKLASGDDLFSTTDINNNRQIGDNDIDVEIIPYITDIDIVGRTYMNRHETWMNIKNLEYRMNRYNDQQMKVLIAQNILHEYCHNLGYRHRGNKAHKNNNKFSVPYGIGSILSKIVLPSDEYAFIERDESFIEHCMRN